MLSPDETRYATIAYEMTLSGDWVVPRFNGVRHFDKPVLGFWILAGTIELFGRSAFTARLPSALAMGLVALLLGLFLRRVGEEREIALLAPTILLSNGLVFGVATFTILDSMLTLFVTVAMLLFFLASEEPRRVARASFLIGYGAALGMAVLTKGFVALAFALGAGVPFLLWQRRYAEIWTLCIAPLLVTLLVALPWALAMHLREPDFWRYFFWIHHVERFISEDAPRRQAVWFYIPAFVGAMMPWMALFPCAFSGIRASLTRPLVRFLSCWFTVPLVFFSLSQGKSLAYMLPAVPAFVLLLAIGLRPFLKGMQQRAFRNGALFLGVTVGALVGVLVVFQLWPVASFVPYSTSETTKWVGGAATLLVFALVATWAALSAQPAGRRLAMVAFGPLLFFLSYPLLVPNMTIERQSPDELLARHRHRVTRETLLVADDRATNALCWAYRRHDIRLLDKGGEFSYGLRYADTRHRLVSARQLAALTRTSYERDIVVLLRRGRYERRYRKLLPKPMFLETWGQFVFMHYRRPAQPQTTHR